MDRSQSVGPSGSDSTPALIGFRTALQSVFRVHVNGTGADLTLIEVVASDRRSGWETFSLLFEGPSPPAFWDGTFTVQHPQLGTFPLFLVAVQTEGDGQHYEAVFNRPRSEPGSA